jgi:hypothetical protein
MVDVAEPGWIPVWVPWSWVRVKGLRVRGLKPDIVDYWKDALPLLSHKLCLKMIDHLSRSTQGQQPSGWVQKCVLPSLKQG